eukprot:761797-Hanusia_phi.AAC.2
MPIIDTGLAVLSSRPREPGRPIATHISYCSIREMFDLGIGTEKAGPIILARSDEVRWGDQRKNGGGWGV